MRFDMLHVVVGDSKCNAKCPFCVSGNKHMDAFNGQVINHVSLNIVKRMAEISGIQKAIITGKGEPMLYPDTVLKYGLELSEVVPLIELQTNGTTFYNSTLTELRDTFHVLRSSYITTVAISTTGDKALDAEYYCREEDDYTKLKEIIDSAHAKGVSIRMVVMLFKNGIDTIGKVVQLLAAYSALGVDQVTLRPLHPEYSGDCEDWIAKHSLDGLSLGKDLEAWLSEKGKLLHEIGHTGRVYDYDKMSVMHTLVPLDGSKFESDKETKRSLIYMHNGEIRHEWESDASILVRGIY